MGASQVSRKSAPKETMNFALAKSCEGRPATPKTCRLAAGSGPPGRPIAAVHAASSGPRRQQVRKGPPPCAGNDRQPAAGRARLGRELGDGVVPRNVRHAAVGQALLGAAHTVRVVERLQPRLAPRAELAGVDRMRRIALELDGPRLARLDVQSAAGGALGAGAGVVGGDAGHLVLGLHQVRNQLLHPVRGATAQRRRSRPGHAEDGQEAPSVHPGVLRLVHCCASRAGSR